MSSNRRAELSLRRRNRRKNKELGTLSESSTTKKNANTKNNNKLNQTGNDSDYKPRGATHHPKVMVYPVARGPRSITGDTLLIKCLEYVPPQTTTSYEQEVMFATKDGGQGDLKYKENDPLIIQSGKNRGLEAKQIKASSFKMVNDGASDRINGLTAGQQEKHIYYVELPIPQDVNDNNSVTWGDDSMNILQLAGLAVAQKAFTQDVGRTFDEAKNLLTEGIFTGASSMIKDESVKQGIVAALTGKAFDKFGANINANSALGRATGMTLNSNLELLFDSVNLRSFPFSMNFTPRTPEESIMVKHIIRAFKSSMAAKKGTSDVGQGGIFLRAPDVFQLRYLHRGKDHPFLNSFKHCALTGMQVNYTNAGTFASYEDGTPVSINMNLTFKELNPIYFEDYDEFSANDNKGVGF
tara:strand:+ start:199 stop:1431 length:1233 start_codon:yes stop_codon:yes gene_type:complete